MNMKRRSFLKKAAIGTTALTVVPLSSYSTDIFKLSGKNDGQHPKLSLAQWSLHRHFFDKKLDPVNFADIAINTYNINAIEYVNQFYVNSGEDEKFWIQMKDRANRAGVKSMLIMVDNEGDLAVSNNRKRKKAVENHFKWVNAAKILGCHSIRVNAFGESNRDAFHTALADGLGRLCDYAAREGINIIIENHGLFSSDAAFITKIIREVHKPNLGTLPDFGNWCLSAKWGTTQFECNKAYDRYQGVTEFLPYAKGVSAKSYQFDEKGDEMIIDYYKMLRIVKESGFNGHIGIEYEGDKLSEHDGILATKALIEKAWKSLASK